jgi:hypothetical protein
VRTRTAWWTWLCSGARRKLFGPVASDPTASRLIGTLTQAVLKVLRLIRKDRVAAREHLWLPAGERAPGGAAR